MNYLVRALIEKAGHDYGFENILPSSEHQVLLGSARHIAQVGILQRHDGLVLRFSLSELTAQLASSFPNVMLQKDAFIVTEGELSALLKMASFLAQSIPNQVTKHYELQVQEELAKLPSNGTEFERLVHQRIGQQNFRQALMTYWGGACAVTGIEVAEVLRASHIKPWAECATDAERLDVFNGFLLSANLDALFDRFLISFDEQGALLISSTLSQVDLLSLGIKLGMKLRWIDALHQPYLAFHRARFNQS